MNLKLAMAKVEVAAKILLTLPKETQDDIVKDILNSFLEPTTCGVLTVRIPSVISTITDGGRLTTDDLLVLGRFILDSNKWTISIRPDRNRKVTITKKEGYDPIAKKAITKDIQIVQYNTDHLPILWQICEEWITENVDKVIY